MKNNRQLGLLRYRELISLKLEGRGRKREENRGEGEGRRRVER